MTAVVFVMDFARGDEEDIVDGVETEPQNLELITSKEGVH
jgi:hypothetical protein